MVTLTWIINKFGFFLFTCYGTLLVMGDVCHVQYQIPDVCFLMVKNVIQLHSTQNKNVKHGVYKNVPAVRMYRYMSIKYISSLYQAYSSLRYYIVHIPRSKYYNGKTQWAEVIEKKYAIVYSNLPLCEGRLGEMTT